ncbi:hypothetical protein SAMN05443246_0452 [Paenibacillus sp. GP183]|nr:hypothetical protein SAMN05443246_0452 [Paenibacillus sp. GP183]
MFLSRKFTFWLSIISIMVCINNYWGNDEKNILLIDLNPFLNSIVYKEPFRHWILDFNNAKITDSASIRVSTNAYYLHFVSFFLMGFIIDLIIYLYKRYRQSREQA